MDVRIDFEARPRKRASLISSAARKMRRLDTGPFALDPRRFETPWPGFEPFAAIPFEVGRPERDGCGHVDVVRRAADDYLTRVERTVRALREEADAHVVAAEETARALVAAAKREAEAHLERARRDAALLHAEAVARVAAADDLAAEWLAEATAERERILADLCGPTS